MAWNQTRTLLRICPIRSWNTSLSVFAGPPITAIGNGEKISNIPSRVNLSFQRNPIPLTVCSDDFSLFSE
jgi:hypothetical protein